MIGIGTIINTVAVVIGGTLGTLLGARMSERIRETVMHGLGLVVLILGVRLSFETTGILIVLGSILLGGILGELLQIEDRFDGIGRWLEKRTTRNRTNAPSAGSTRFSQAFLTSSLVFCVGPMAILGSFQDGLDGKYETLAIKSALDLFVAMAFASTMGPGVIFSALAVLAYQGALTLGAQWASVLLTDPMIAEMTATGGVLMLAIGFRLLEIRRIRAGNLLPALAIAPLIVAIVAWLPSLWAAQ